MSSAQDMTGGFWKGNFELKIETCEYKVGTYQLEVGAHDSTSTGYDSPVAHL